MAQDDASQPQQSNKDEAAQAPQAQEAIPGDQSAQAQSGNQIIVTGLRRSDTLQDTPAAITAFGSQEIANAGIQKPADFINLTSNVNLVEVQNVGTSFVVIRGIGQARNSEPSVAVVQKNTDKHGTTKVAQDFLQYLYSPQAQEIEARNFYRPRDPAILAKYKSQFPSLALATVDGDFGGWAKAQATHFADGGIFDQITAK